MKKFFIPIAVALLLAAPAYAQDVETPPATLAATTAPTDESAHFGWADVLRVDPVYDDPATNPPPQPCYEEQVPVDASAADNAQAKRGIATVIGAFIGGLFGNQVGKGKGRAAATVVGAVAGGAVGNHLAAADTADAPPRYTMQRHCPPAAVSARKANAYDVEYRYRGDVYTSRLSYDPGDRMRVRVRVTPAE